MEGEWKGRGSTNFFVFSRKFRENFHENFRENFRYFRNFRKEIFAKSENKFSRNFRENTKTKIFVSTLISADQSANLALPREELFGGSAADLGFSY